MGSHNETCTDEEFLKLWDQYKSTSKVAKVLCVTERAVAYRRRNLEIEQDR